MRTISIINLKGGVGKTATAVNMAAILAIDYEQRVLLIDADAQCNTTEFYGGDPGWGNLANVLRHEDNDGCYAASEIQDTTYERIDLLAADESLMDLDLTKVELNKVQTMILRSMIEELEKRDLYDWVIIDCPPAFNAASAAALVASDEAIIPMKLDAFSLRGMGNILRQLQNMTALNPKLHLDGLLPTMWYNSPIIKDAEAQLRGCGLPVFNHIRRTPKVDDMTFRQEPIIVSSPRSAAAADYRHLVHALVGGKM